MRILPERRAASSVDTPVGRVFVVAGPSGLVWLGFGERPAGAHTGETPINSDLLRPLTDSVLRWFDDPSALDSLPLDAPVSPFGTAVRAAVRRVPAGHRTTYGALARRLGRPGASQAVGRALGSNPIAIAVPCHRVIRHDGDPGGYAWGRDRKVALLEFEYRNTSLGGRR